jgi:hypothetical protein
MSDAAYAELRKLVERIVQPVRVNLSRKSDMQQELLAHVLAVFEDERVRLGDEQSALQRTVLGFGNPAELSDELRKSITAVGHIGWLLEVVFCFLLRSRMLKHNRLYNIFLVLLGVNLLCGLCLLMFLLGMPPDARPRMLIPQWSLSLLALIHGFYLLAITATLAVHSTRLAIGKHVTTAMNCLFLIAPPLGTAVGIYGLWKVAREPEAGVAMSS